MDAATAAQIVAAARACVGVPFRPQGRDPALGLDCIGLAAFAYRAIGVTGAIPADYRMRGDQLGRLLAVLSALGLQRGDQLVAGGVWVGCPAMAQWHLGIWTGNSLIHADMAARRVVEWPDVPIWPTHSVWMMG